ncbi:hypothetical protein PTTG_28213 [Puccinia triticina 1-1 BBBD Race 1]|uniref:Uncharacterized protein n=1 Tax=Puccinia triticina (isolate 1-1 / race 1 (BBBD)) TaxID=630390 RepID=A0A180GDS5_PUCT1|nr:hypothetical protein PTTG_28213 [Puccinia triticina 1-1 BBBD Race 1]
MELGVLILISCSISRWEANQFPVHQAQIGTGDYHLALFLANTTTLVLVQGSANPIYFGIVKVVPADTANIQYGRVGAGMPLPDGVRAHTLRQARHLPQGPHHPLPGPLRPLVLTNNGKKVPLNHAAVPVAKAHMRYKEDRNPTIPDLLKD